MLPPPSGALWTVKILPMFRDPAPIDPAEADPPVGAAILSGPEASPAGSADLWSGWAAAGTGQTL